MMRLLSFCSSVVFALKTIIFVGILSNESNNMRNILSLSLKLAVISVTCSVLACVAVPVSAQRVMVGAERFDQYLPTLAHKRVAILGNQTSQVGDVHLLDTLLSQKVQVTAIFSPEHGFRGKADAGAHVKSGKDVKTGVPILSLYNGKGGRPSTASMNQFDVLLVDMQDVGLRFYTYYITMCKMMEACGQYNKKVIVLDRPNPNIHVVDGPILNMKYKSGVGYLPIPVLHGMTMGEIALMANGKKWLKQQCNLQVVPCANYTRQTEYSLPIAPSPNLRTMRAIYMYASLCLFEGTPVSAGRGTNHPFECFGHPDLKDMPYSFMPKSGPGARKPKFKDRICHGRLFTGLAEEEAKYKGLDLSYVVEAYQQLKDKKFFTSFFELLIGVDYVRDMIEKGASADEIAKHWHSDVECFKNERAIYLLYPED